MLLSILLITFLLALASAAVMDGSAGHFVEFELLPQSSVSLDGSIDQAYMEWEGD